jgi:hypothetical protein
MPMTTEVQQESQESQLTRQQLRDQIRQQVREHVQMAKEQAAAAREEAAMAKEHARLAREQASMRSEHTAATQMATGAGMRHGQEIPREAVDISIAFFVTVALVILGLPLLRAFGRRLGAPVPAPVADPDVDARLTRIEHAVQAVAIEVERIGEGQRFTAQLFAKAGGDPALASRKPASGS